MSETTITTSGGSATAETTGQQSNGAVENAIASQVAARNDAPAADESAAEQGGFDTAAIEAEYGLPAGALKDVQDETSAYDVIRQHMDQSLMARMTAAQQAAPAETEAAKPAGEKPKPGSVEERVAKLEARLEAEQQWRARISQAAQQQYVTQLNKQFMEEVDSWNSEKYGTTGKRNFKQTQALKALAGLVDPMTGGLEDAKQVRAIAKSARVYDDETFKPTSQKLAENTAQSNQPLGTPGGTAARAAAAKDGPRNIHEAGSQW